MNIKILAKGKLEIHGITQLVTIPVGMINTTNSYKIRSEFNVKLEDFNIKIPLILEEKISPCYQSECYCIFSQDDE